jgi:hypothetical protein
VELGWDVNIKCSLFRCGFDSDKLQRRLEVQQRYFDVSVYIICIMTQISVVLYGLWTTRGLLNYEVPRN